METAQVIEAIEALVKLGTFVSNAVGASDQVGAIISARIASGATEWTDEQRKVIDDALTSNKAYAAAQLAIPDDAPGVPMS